MDLYTKMKTVSHYLRLCDHIIQRGYGLEKVSNEPEDISAVRKKLSRLEYALVKKEYSLNDFKRQYHGKEFERVRAEIRLMDDKNKFQLIRGAWINLMQAALPIEQRVRVTVLREGKPRLLQHKISNNKLVVWGSRIGDDFF